MRKLLKKEKLVTVCGRQCKFCGFPVRLWSAMQIKWFPGGLGGVSPPGGSRGRSPLVRLRIREAVDAY